MLEPMGLSLKDSPQVVQSLKDGMLVGTADAVEFRNAPIYMKEALTFPYRYGIDFIAELLIKGGKEKAFAELFRNPPRTTRQIMEPQTYLSGERLEPMNVPDFRQVFKNYERFDVGAVGEFDVAVLIDQYAGASRFRTSCIRTGEAATTMRCGPRAIRPRRWALLYASRWSSPEKAANFAAIYASALSKRYLHVHDVLEDGQGACDQDRCLGPSDRQASLADRGRARRHRRAGRHRAGHRESGSGDHRQRWSRKCFGPLGGCEIILQRTTLSGRK